MSRGRIEDIEILRGFAVLSVVLHHAHGNLFTWSTPALERLAAYFGGGFGVDLFFVISGYVISRDLVPRLQGCESSQMACRITLAFWIRRAWRLLPSAWTWLAIVLVAAVVFNESGAFGTLRANIEATVAGVLQVANLRFAETFGNREYGASFVYWTLSLEEQFYLLLPVVILFSRRYLPHVLIVLVLYQLFSERSLLSVVFRSDSLAMGVLLALWSRHFSYSLARPVFFMRGWFAGTVVLCVALLFLGIIGSNVLQVVSYRFSLLALLSALLVWLASYDGNIFLPSGLLRRAMLWVGARSYAIYLIHVPAFMATREIWTRANPGAVFDTQYFYPFLLTAGALIVVLCELNFRFIETPLRLRGAAIARAYTGDDVAAEPERATADMKVQ
ncbi:acyltransferase [Pseudomonas sp.]|uniref:acyltransferase family protein n=1 Tax=Pseudomonas sp. TaxID=306 RepID=UPI00291110F7|nr:acyltransferase [Pseudomonas sp.]MDU4250143.1 acyltransferase [Pseudomonas sp.]